MEHPTLFHRRAEQEAAKLKTEDCHITSVENFEVDPNHVAGRVITAPRSLAGVYIAKRTHRVSTPEEVIGYNADQLARRREILKDESDRHPRTYMDPETIAAMTTTATQAAMASRQQQNNNNQKENR